MRVFGNIPRIKNIPNLKISQKISRFSYFPKISVESKIYPAYYKNVKKKKILLDFVYVGYFFSFWDILGHLESLTFVVNILCKI